MCTFLSAIFLCSRNIARRQQRRSEKKSKMSARIWQWGQDSIFSAPENERPGRKTGEPADQYTVRLFGALSTGFLHEISVNMET
jgi:hypothetical protein